MTPNTESIKGKVAATSNEENTNGLFTFNWATVFSPHAADSIVDGYNNTQVLATPAGQYPAAQACLNKTAEGFNDWYLPAICELGRYTGLGFDSGCGSTNANLYTTLHSAGLGNFDSFPYWSSTEM